MSNIEIQKCWLIREWSGKAVEGEGFLLTYSYYGESKKAFFRESESVIWEQVNAKEIVFTKVHATNAVERDVLSKREYYEKEIKNYTQKLEQLTPKQ